MDMIEAKKMLRARLECMKQEDLRAVEKGCNKECDECHLNYEQGNRGEQKEAISVGIAALKLQIPKKPMYEVDAYDAYDDSGSLIYDTWICPQCESRYEVGYDDYDFCPNCGQAIDWRKSDEEGNDDDKDSDESDDQVRTYRHPLADTGTYIL